MMNRYFMLKKMREGGDSTFRPEQERADHILQLFFPGALFEQEKFIPGLELPDPKMSPLGCIADISMTQTCPRCKKILERIIRCQGESHRLSDAQRRKDDKQRRILEHNEKLVIDFWYDMMPALWLGEDMVTAVREVGKFIQILL